MSRFLDSGEMQLLAWWMGVRWGHLSTAQQGNTRSKIIKQLKREPGRRPDFFVHVSAKRKEFLAAKAKADAEQRARDEAAIRDAEPNPTDAFFVKKGASTWQ